jgi:hypothetical protein
MSYSDAFEWLDEKAVDLNLMVEVKYKRVAVYIGRVMMSEAAIQFGIKNNTRPPNGIIDWALKVKGDKESMLYNFLLLTDAEWEKIKPVMERLAKQSGGSDAWKVKRMEYVCALDTLRAFEHE